MNTLYVCSLSYPMLRQNGPGEIFIQLAGTGLVLSLCYRYYHNMLIIMVWMDHLGGGRVRRGFGPLTVSFIGGLRRLERIARC